MDRYFAWLISDYMLNRREAETNPDYVPEIFRPTSPKLVFWGFAMAIVLVVALAIIGYPIREAVLLL